MDFKMDQIEFGMAQGWNGWDTQENSNFFDKNNIKGKSVVNKIGTQPLKPVLDPILLTLKDAKIYNGIAQICVQINTVTGGSDNVRDITKYHGLYDLKTIDFEYELECEYEFERKYNHEHQTKNIKIEEENIIIRSYHFNVRCPVHIYDYPLSFKLRCRFNNEFEWSQYSNELIVNMHSSLIKRQLQIGDVINVNRRWCKIISFSNAKYDDDDNDDLLYSVQDVRTNKMSEVPQSKITFPSITVHADLSDQSIIDKTLLVHDDDDGGHYGLMKLLNDFYENDSVYKECMNDYTLGTGQHFIAKYVALNVLYCLYGMDECIKYSYKIKCTMIGDDGWLRKEQMRTHKYNACLLEYRLVEDDYARERVLDPQYSNKEGTCYYCDMCDCSQSAFYWMYHCSEYEERQHDICLSCIYSVVNQYNELNQLLFGITELNEDCTKQIVCFVVGEVVKIETHNTDHNNDDTQENQSSTKKVCNCTCICL